MLRFFQYLYWSDDIPEKQRNSVKWRLKVHKKNCLVYCITLHEGADQLDIYHSSVLLQGYYRRNPPLVIGIAASYDNAIELVRRITEECYRKTKDANIKKYLSELQD